MITDGLFLAMSVAVVLQPNAARLYGALCFTSVTILHGMALGELSGLAYYGSAALGDVLVLGLLLGVGRPPLMVVRLARVCVASAVLNLIGYVVWLAYLAPVMYDAAFTALYAYALWVMCRGGLISDRATRDFSRSRWRACFTFDSSAGRRVFSKAKGSL